MRFVFGIILVLCVANLFAQRKQVYLFPGQGADGALFSKMVLPDCDTHIISYPVPKRHESIPAYARRLAMQIDTTQPFYLVGVSFGGMNAVEIGKFLKPEKIIVISSAKCKYELPFRYRFQKIIPMYKIFSGRFYKRMAQLARPIVEKDSRQYDSLFRAMIARKDPRFMKRSIGMICRWKNKTYDRDIIHIHGTKDHTLPHRKILNAISIVDGSHMMTYTKAYEINAWVIKNLE